MLICMPAEGGPMKRNRWASFVLSMTSKPSPAAILILILKGRSSVPAVSSNSTPPLADRSQPSLPSSSRSKSWVRIADLLCCGSMVFVIFNVCARLAM